MKRETVVRLAAAVAVAAAGACAYGGAVADVTERLSPLTAVYNGTNSYRAAQAESHIGYLRVHKNVTTETGTSVTFDVDEGKTLTIDTLRGGRGVGSKFTKTGGGVLKIGDGLPYGGTVVIRGGTLDMAKRAVPTKAELPANPFLHIDASDVSSLVTTNENGRKYVSFWSSDGVGTVNGQKVVGVQASESWKHPRYFRPWMMEDALGPGRHALDFGTWNASGSQYFPSSTYSDETWPVACGGFVFVTNENYEASARVDPTGFRTYIAVIGAQRGGGTPLCDSSTRNHGERPFERGGNRDSSKNWSQPIAHAYKYYVTGETVTPTVWQDGRRVAVSQRFDYPFYHVIAVRCDPKNFSFRYIGAYIYANGQVTHGGMALSEMFIYDRDLTDTEIEEVQAYLSRKWFGVTNPGYRRDDGLPDLERVEIAGASTIAVPAGTTNRIGLLKLNAPLVKSGGGVLEVFNVNGGGSILLEGGDVRYADRPDSGDELCAIAPGASFHLDPTVLGTAFSTTSDNGTNRVDSMSSLSGGTAAMSSGKPWVVTNDTLNSLPMLFFGTKNNSGPYMNIVRPLDGIRSVFMVWDTRAWNTSGSGGYSIGSADYSSYVAENVNSSIYDFFRDNDPPSGTNGRLTGNIGSDMARFGVTMATNGVSVSWQARPTRDFQLVEIHPSNPAHASGVKIAVGRTSTAGLGMMGDIIVYERELTEREKVQTRNYLMKKWFNATPVALPEKPASKAGECVRRRIAVDGERRVNLGEAISNVTVSGSGTFVKGGQAEMQTLSLLDFTGTVKVAEGRLVLNGVSTGYGAKMATSGQILRFDASEGQLNTVLDPSGTLLYTATNLATEASEVATIRRGSASVTVSILHDELNDLDVAKMASGSYMKFYDSAGNATFLHDIQSLFWIVGSQEGGGFLMGGGTNVYKTGTAAKYPYHRGTKTVDGVEYNGFQPGGHVAPITNSNGQKEYQNGSFRLNMRSTAVYNGLTGGYDLLSMVIPELDGTTNIYPLNAEGFAFDGRNINYGCQRLGEVLAYNRRLSAQEVRETETYLAVKWGLCRAVAAGATSAGVEVAPGAVLDLGSTTQTVAFVSGGGLVTNGCLAASALKCDFASPATLTVESFSFPSGFSVVLENASPAVENGFYPLVAAREYDGEANARSAAITGSAIPVGKKARLAFQSGVYGVRMRDAGVMVIIK